MQIVPNRANRTIEVKVNAGVPMTFMRVAGIETVNAPVDSVTAFQANDLELGMALDITGSMAAASSPNSRRRHRSRHNAAPGRRPVPTGAHRARAVCRCHPARAVCQRCLQWHQQRRMRARTHGLEAYSDASLRDGGAYRGAGSTTDLDPTEGRQGYFCPSAQIVPLTDDRSTLTSSIARFSANGSTADTRRTVGVEPRFPELRILMADGERTCRL